MPCINVVGVESTYMGGAFEPGVAADEVGRRVAKGVRRAQIGPQQNRGPLVLGLIVTNALWTVVCVRAGVLIDGLWFFWAEGIGFALVTLVLVAIWLSGGDRHDSGAREA